MDVHIPVEDYLQQQGKIISDNKYFQQQNKSGGTVTKGNDSTMEEKLTAHDYELKEIRNILGSVANNQKETNVQVGRLAESMTKLDLYLERQNAIKEEYSNTIKRVFYRMEELDKHIDVFYTISTDYKLSKKDIESHEKRLTTIEDGRNKIVWAVLTAVGMAVLGLVVK